jgi:glycosyltransferase involved in cell wall biosynthesis
VSDLKGRVRVLYSFPHKLGGNRICYIAWQQVKGLASAGAEILAFPGVLQTPVPANVRVKPTLARGRVRIPYKVLGSMRAFALHDFVVARRLRKLAGQVDIVHAWPLGALETLRTAAKLGVPTVLERPNAHTRFAYEVVEHECRRLGVTLPSGYEHSYNADVLRKEEQEYELATRLLCPSDFVVRTFLDQGFSGEKLARTSYGFDENRFFPEHREQGAKQGITMLFVGLCAVRKGLHYALEAWLQSSAHRDGAFLIAGEFLPEYATKLSSMLSHPSVHVLGQRSDIPELMRRSDILILPSIEEGFGLVIAEAMASGCVPLASEACTETCRHMVTGLVHRVGDVEALTQQINLVNDDRALLVRLRANCLSAAPDTTWSVAGTKLLHVYREVIAAKRGGTDGRV